MTNSVINKTSTSRVVIYITAETTFCCRSRTASNKSSRQTMPARQLQNVNETLIDEKRVSPWARQSTVCMQVLLENSTKLWKFMLPAGVNRIRGLPPCLEMSARPDWFFSTWTLPGTFPLCYLRLILQCRRIGLTKLWLDCGTLCVSLLYFTYHEAFSSFSIVSYHASLSCLSFYLIILSRNLPWKLRPGIGPVFNARTCMYVYSSQKTLMLPRGCRLVRWDLCCEMHRRV